MKNSYLLLALLSLPISALAQKKPGEAASIGKVEIQGDAKPGGNVVAIVHVKLEKAWHVQSNKPSEPNFIPTVLKLDRKSTRLNSSHSQISYAVFCLKKKKKKKNKNYT